MIQEDRPVAGRESIAADQHLLTINEAASRAGVSLQTVYDWLRRGHLMAVETDDGPMRVRRAEVMKLQEVRRIAADAKMRIATVQQWIGEAASHGGDVLY